MVAVVTTATLAFLALSFGPDRVLATTKAECSIRYQICVDGCGTKRRCLRLCQTHWQQCQWNAQ
jgi:hypothetical protein